jgi:hypothetical protein
MLLPENGSGLIVWGVNYDHSAPGCHVRSKIINLWKTVVFPIERYGDGNDTAKTSALLVMCPARRGDKNLISKI